MDLHTHLTALAIAPGTPVRKAKNARYVLANFEHYAKLIIVNNQTLLDSGHMSMKDISYEIR